MKKILLLISTAIFLLTGCSDMPKIEANANNAKQEPKVSETQTVFKPLDTIHYDLLNLTLYEFGGFPSDDRFVINVTVNEAAVPLFFTLKEGKIFTLPQTKIQYQVKSFDLENDMIELVKLSKK